MGKPKDKSKHKHKRDKRHKEKSSKHRRQKSSSESSSSAEEWVEKEVHSSLDKEQSTSNKSTLIDEKSTELSKANDRDEWMSLPTTFLSESNRDRRHYREEKKRLDRERDQYNPREHVRELNPYWKDGGDGLPKFQKPSDDNDYHKPSPSNRPRISSGWKKKPAETTTKSRDSIDEKTVSDSREDEPSEKILTDKELNQLASRLVKAEIMGNTKLIEELKQKLENARKLRGSNPGTLQQSEEVLLTQTDSRGQARPVKLQSDYGESSSRPNKRKKVETHQDGQRVRYFADDDKQSLQQMFENEKFNSIEDQNSEFIKLAGKIRKNDDMDEIFADNIRKEDTDSKINARNRDRAINEHRKVAESIDNCRLCLQSDSMPKHLMVSLGETVFLSLPPHEPLNEGHCWIIPIRHVTCSTLLDENEWSDIMDMRKALTRMFNARNEDVIFFETAKNFEKYPHMHIECIPVAKEEGDMAPIYFKKAIDECEVEWAQNKKLVSLKGRDVRRAIPKGLPYFFVSFGMDEGYGHVIEDQNTFPQNFAQEIIGGMLDLHHSKWRKPKMQSFDEQSRRTVEFSKIWSEYDCTNKT